MTIKLYQYISRLQVYVVTYISKCFLSGICLLRKYFNYRQKLYDGIKAKPACNTIISPTFGYDAITTRYIVLVNAHTIRFTSDTVKRKKSL